MICTELMKCNLESMLLNPQNKLSLLQRMKMARDAALGVLWLHSSNPVFIHRDLKTSNLLIDDNNTVKVCDFGLSQIKPRGTNLKDGQEGAKGTPLWMAPEVLLGKHFNEKADVYSFGLVLWQMMSRQELFPQFDNLDKFIHAICIDGLRPKIPQDTPPSLERLITACWQAESEGRPHFSNIVEALNTIIIECAIPDELGAVFWNQNFREKEQVSWRDFVNSFSMGLGIASPVPMYDILQYSSPTLNPELELGIRCLKAVAVSIAQVQGQEEEVVTMEMFGKVLAWFGNLRADNAKILEKIKIVLASSWFHGDISMPESEARLANKPDGTYLVRFSTSEMGAFTISKVSTTGISHQRLMRTQGMYMMNKKSYQTITDLIRAEASQLNLLNPCGGSRYLALFRKQQLSGYLN